MEEKEFQDLLKQHNEALASIEKASALVLNDKQKKAFEIFKEDFIDALDVDENGNITMSSKNILKLNSLDEQFEKLAKNFNKTMVSTLANNVSKIVESNVKYFSGLDGDAKLLPIIPKVKNAISGWLGISEGKVAKNGFIDQLVESDSAKIAIKNLAMKIVIGQQGKAKAKEELQTLIEGNPKTLGAFEKHYKTFANDLNSQIDRATSNVIRNDLKLEFAIYVGGLIETSRIFCEEHNGKIYHISEILQFDPKVGIPPNYEPISDLGGYNCRHHLRWISRAMAKAKGKDVDNFGTTPIKPIKPDEEVKKTIPEPKKKTEEIKPVEFNKIPKDIDFDKVEFKNEEFIPDAKFKKNIKIYSEVVEGFKNARSKFEEIKIEYDLLIKQSRKLKYNQQDEIKAIRPIISAKFNEMDKQRLLIWDFKNKMNKNSNEGFKDLIKGKKEKADFKFKIEGKSYSREKEIGDILDDFKIIGAKYFDKVDFTFKFNASRANYRRNGDVVSLSPRESKEVIFHELGHSLENNKFVLKVAVDFLNKRTKDSKVLSLKKEVNNSYTADEKFKRGDFFTEYVGKIYGGIRYNGIDSTEIISMGIEQMYKNPHQFYLLDKEHFELIYNLFIR